MTNNIMQNLIIEATKRTPSIHFDFDKHELSFGGESYPEDVNAFYRDVIQSLDDYFNASVDQRIIVDFDMVYFNSSSAKAMIRLFDMIDEAAKKNEIIVNWAYEEDDDNMAELGEEFGEDLEKAAFNLVVKA